MNNNNAMINRWKAVMPKNSPDFFPERLGLPGDTEGASCSISSKDELAEFLKSSSIS